MGLVFWVLLLEIVIGFVTDLIREEQLIRR
jgi:hypothetical protein